MFSGCTSTKLLIGLVCPNKIEGDGDNCSHNELQARS